MARPTTAFPPAIDDASSRDTAATAPEHDQSATGPAWLSPWLIVLLAVALRWPLLLLTTGSDYWFYQSLGRLSNLGFYPYIHYWLEYPPVFPWLAVAVYRITTLFPPALFGDADATFHTALGTISVLADAGIVALIGAIGGELWPRGEYTRRMLVYAVLFWPIAVAVGWYDALPCALMLLGLYLLLRARPAGAGALAGLGFMTKIIPGLLGPVAVKFLPRRGWLTTLVTAVTVTLAIAVPLLIVSPTYFIASYRAVFSRSSWETVYALLDGYFSYGKVAPIGVRFDPTTAGYVAFPSRLPAIPVAIVFAIAYLVLWLRPVARTARNVVTFTALSTLLFLLYSKGYSPQFIIYLLPFILLLLPWRRAIGYTLALSAINLLEWPLYHEWLSQVHWVLVLAVVARTLLWLGLGAEWLAELWQLRNPIAAIRLSRRTLTVAAASALVVAIVLSALAIRTWTQAYYNGSDLRPAYDFVQRYEPAAGGKTAFVLTDDDLYERFHPYFWREGDFYLLRPESAGDQTYKVPQFTPDGQRATLETIARDHAQIVFIRTEDDWTSRDLNDWLTQHMQAIGTVRAANADVSIWRTPPPTPHPPGTP
ncbi:MAG TPA: glycosyltransferase 87 family protein [Thermomicrobiales bacterium]|nr:glycosyltransferase 87 family protein [Thermomicrobiales bacterium]